MLATEETEAEGWKISGLPGLQSKFITNLKNLVRSCLKIKSEKGVVLECLLSGTHEASGSVLGLWKVTTADYRLMNKYPAGFLHCAAAACL